MRPSRRLIALTLGLAALTVLLIVLLRDGAAVLAVLWAGMALVALGDLFASTPARNITLDPDLPETGFVGLDAGLTLEIATRKGSLPQRVEVRVETGQGLVSAPLTRLDFGAGVHKAQTVLPLRMVSRGDQTVSGVYMRFASRFGLFEILPRWAMDLTISVQPNIQPALSGEIQTQMMPLLDGMKSTHAKGEGSEFHQLRDFVPGMDPRAIDWKRSARMHALVARETRAERNHQIMICLDHGHLMAEQIGDLTKLDHAINAGLALSWAGLLGGDRVGFYSFGPRPGDMVPPGSGQAAFARIRKTCAGLEQSETETNHTLAMVNLHSTLNRRTLVVVFSDFVDSVTAELLIENMAIMSRQHLVLYVTLRDGLMDQMSRPEKVNMETISQAVSASRLRQERAAVLDRLQRLGVHCLDADPATLTPDLVSRYIDIKLQGFL